MHAGIFGFSIFHHVFCHIADSFVTGGGNHSTRRKLLPNPKSLATFSHAPASIWAQAVVRDS